MGKNIVLIGFIGTGKSTIGKSIACRSGKTLIEIDDMITGSAGKTRAEIFTEGGEDLFREIEADQIQKAALQNDVIISCGGGAVLLQENVERLKENGIMILLTASLDTVMKRTKNEARRTISGCCQDPMAVYQLMKEREDLYKAAADIIIDTDNRTVNEIVDEIIHKPELDFIEFTVR